MVMKKALKFQVLLVILFTATIYCEAQENFKVGITMGQVYPLNEFKSTDNSSTKSGYAQTGFTLNVDGDYYIHNRFSFTLRFHLGNAPINQSAYKEKLNTELKDYFSAEDTVRYNINYWQWATPLVGFKVNYPIVLNKIYIEAGIFSGVCFIQLPDQNLIFNDKKNKQFIISQTIENTDISIPLVINGGFRFRINNSVQLKLNAEYFQTKANYNHVSYIEKEGTTERTEIKKYELNAPIQTLNASLGLVYSF
jgi:hypothetical protein